MNLELIRLAAANLFRFLNFGALSVFGIRDDGLEGSNEYQQTSSAAFARNRMVSPDVFCVFSAECVRCDVDSVSHPNQKIKKGMK